MNADELCFLSITQLSEQIQKREISPVECPSLSASYSQYRQQTEQLSHCHSRTSPARSENGGSANPKGKYHGPLHGIPLAHKDIIATKGIKTTCASKVLRDAIPYYDATTIERLRAAGSVLLGKLNMNEFATTSPSMYFGRVNNPWNFAHNPGGSSSGSGAAVAQDCVPAHSVQTLGDPSAFPPHFVASRA